MKLSSEEVMKLNAGLRSLDGYDRVIKDGEKDRVVREFYKLGGGLRLLLAKNQNLLEGVIKTFQTARNALLTEMRLIDGNIPKERAAEFVEQERQMLEQEYEVPLLTFNSEQLKLDQNPIPISTLALIHRLLDDETIELEKPKPEKRERPVQHAGPARHGRE